MRQLAGIKVHTSILAKDCLDNDCSDEGPSVIVLSIDVAGADEMEFVVSAVLSVTGICFEAPPAGHPHKLQA